MPPAHKAPLVLPAYKEVLEYKEAQAPQAPQAPQEYKEPLALQVLLEC